MGGYDIVHEFSQRGMNSLSALNCQERPQQIPALCGLGAVLPVPLAVIGLESGAHRLVPSNRASRTSLCFGIEVRGRTLLSKKNRGV